MRPNRYEIALWVLTFVLVVVPHPLTMLAAGLTATDPSCSGFLATSCAPSAWYLFLGQAEMPLIAAGLVLAGVALGVRAVGAHVRAGATASAAGADAVPATPARDDEAWDAFRPPRA